MSGQVFADLFLGFLDGIAVKDERGPAAGGRGPGRPDEDAVVDQPLEKIARQLDRHAGAGQGG